MKEYKMPDGSVAFVGSLSEIDARFALAQKPAAELGILPVFNVDQFPMVVALSLAVKVSEGRTARSIAQDLANQKLQATFGPVALLADRDVLAEVVQDANQNVTSVRILFGTELINASLSGVTDFAQTHRSLARSAERMKRDHLALPLLVSALWQSQVDRYAQLAFQDFCGGIAPPAAIGRSDPRIWASYDAGHVPSGSAQSAPAYDHRQFQN